METEKRISQSETPPGEAVLTPEPPHYRGLRWVFMGDQGLRAGWSVALFIIFVLLFLRMMGAAASLILKHQRPVSTNSLSPVTVIIGKTIEVLALLGAGLIAALIERRHIWDYYLAGTRCLAHVAGGLVAGFAALSALVGALVWGGWLHFGPAELSGAQIFSYGALWTVAFLLVGLSEEGSFRCYLQYTFTRGLNFWWALGIVGAVCLELLLTAKGDGVRGVYGFALLGGAPCLWLHLKKAEGSSFWQAAWVTSTLFGFNHTFNGGENRIGIFQVEFIGFVFCVSIWLTGSAWWAIGCHAAWDWAETFFYGTANSGKSASGHFLTTSPVGNVMWSGGPDGPEGSLLSLGAILLLLAALILIYGRGRPTERLTTTRE